jgi:hypothetical protein
LFGLGHVEISSPLGTLSVARRRTGSPILAFCLCLACATRRCHPTLRSRALFPIDFSTRSWTHPNGNNMLAPPRDRRCCTTQLPERPRCTSVRF